MGNTFLVLKHGEGVYQGNKEQNQFIDLFFFPQRYIETTPLKRVGTPEEAADLAVFLTSEKTTFITGAIINLDGGKSISNDSFQL